ncbi:hypothetical protein FY112_30635 [Rhizobium sp. PEPV16]|nr:hypothetical protein FY112_30635 [Rhizobium sp. PEPV16]
MNFKKTAMATLQAAVPADTRRSFRLLQGWSLIYKTWVLLQRQSVRPIFPFLVRQQHLAGKPPFDRALRESDFCEDLIGRRGSVQCFTPLLQISHQFEKLVVRHRLESRGELTLRDSCKIRHDIPPADGALMA